MVQILTFYSETEIVCSVFPHPRVYSKVRARPCDQAVTFNPLITDAEKDYKNELF